MHHTPNRSEDGTGKLGQQQQRVLHSNTKDVGDLCEPAMCMPSCAEEGAEGTKVMDNDDGGAADPSEQQSDHPASDQGLTSQDDLPAAGLSAAAAAASGRDEVHSTAKVAATRIMNGTLQKPASAHQAAAQAQSAGLAASWPRNAAREGQIVEDAAGSSQAPSGRRQVDASTRRVSLNSPVERFRRVMAEAAKAQKQHDQRHASSSTEAPQDGRMGLAETPAMLPPAFEARPGGPAQPQPGFSTSPAGQANTAGLPPTGSAAPPAAMEAAMQVLLRNGGLLDQLRREAGTAQQSLQASFQAVRG